MGQQISGKNQCVRCGVVSFIPLVIKELDLHEEASFIPRTILDNKYLVDWEQPDNDENPVLVLVEP